MKISKIFSVFLFLLMVTIYTACDADKLAPQESPGQEKEWIKLRDLCSDCVNNNDCCCGIWLEEGEDLANVFICNVIDGSTACSGQAVGNCSSFTSDGDLFELDDSSNPRDTFCIAENVPFYIRNTSTTETINVVISCQEDLFNPQTEHLEIGPGKFFYFETNGDCEIGPCE